MRQHSMGGIVEIMMKWGTGKLTPAVAMKQLWSILILDEDRELGIAWDKLHLIEGKYIPIPVHM